MKLSDTNLSVQDREWVERELPPGEELLLVCKPATTLWKPGYAYRMLFATLWNGFLFGILGMLFINHITLEKIIEKPAILLLFLGLLPFYLIGIGFIISPWWERENDRRTVYVLTNRRAIVMRPSMIRRRPTCRRFPLTHDLIKEVREYRKGRGDIVMGYDEHHGSNGTTLMPKGFLHVDNVRELEYRIYQYLPDAPPPTEATGDSTPERPGLGYGASLFCPLPGEPVYTANAFPEAPGRGVQRASHYRVCLWHLHSHHLSLAQGLPGLPRSLHFA